MWAVRWVPGSHERSSSIESACCSSERSLRGGALNTLAVFSSGQIPLTHLMPTPEALDELSFRV
jgi:hypothetical protein